MTDSSSLAPLPPEADYFSYLLGETRLDLDGAALTRRFYAAHRAVHPDRFAQRSPEEQALSQAHAEFLNQAYRTLKDPLLRARYFLSRQASPPAPLPPDMTLVGALFDLQLLDDPEARATRRAALAQDVSDACRVWEAALRQAFRAWDEAHDAVAITRIAEAEQRLQQARALIRQLESPAS